MILLDMIRGHRHLNRCWPRFGGRGTWPDDDWGIEYVCINKYLGEEEECWCIVSWDMEWFNEDKRKLAVGVERWCLGVSCRDLIYSRVSFASCAL